ncbi:hypothetical protein KJ616_01550 [Patescibacteria group bacterium]|nr:hypothetical protein [Patescibacteria group bacterium]
MYKYWSLQEISLLKKNYPKLWVKDLIVLFPDRTNATITAKAKNLGIPSAKLWQSSENNILRKYFVESSRKKLSKLLPRRSWAAILAQGERLGLRRKTNKPTLYVNEFYFRKWSPNMAYVLGFTFADGGIVKVTKNGYSDKLGFGVNQRDADVLQKIRRELSAKQKLSVSGNAVYFSIYSQVIVDDLKKLGISYRKSFLKSRGRIPDIPKKYIWDFIRGLIDGDGGISIDKKERPTLRFCGKKEIVTFVRNHFLSKFNLYSKISQAKHNGNHYNLFFIAYRCNTAKTLINYLYKNANIYLERKFTLAQKVSKITIKSRPKNLYQKRMVYLPTLYPSSGVYMD